MKIQEKLKLHFIYFNLSSSQLKMAHEGEQTEDESSKMMKTWIYNKFHNWLISYSSLAFSDKFFN